MKKFIVASSLSLVAIFCFAAFVKTNAAMADEDQYIGMYDCSIKETTDCNKCPGYQENNKGWAISVNKLDGNMYLFSVHNMYTGEIDFYRSAIEYGGKFYYTDSESGYGVSMQSSVQGEISGNQLRGVESGTMSGACSCSYRNDFTCTK